MNKDITLQLDHINGVNDDNRIENLRFLCPNCHSQTSTFTGRNKGRTAQNIKPSKNTLENLCIVDLKEVAIKFSVSLRTIYSWYNEYDINYNNRVYQSLVLTDDEIYEIKNTYRLGKSTQRSLAGQYDVSKTTIARVLKLQK